MKRRLSGCIAVLCIGTTGMAWAAGSAQDTFAPWNGWSRIADGVYQKTDYAGVTQQVSFGAGGARYDRQLIQNDIDRLNAGKHPSDQSRAQIAAYTEQLDAISPFSDGTVVPDNFSSGTACGAGYQFDSDFIAATAGANLVARGHTGLPISIPPGVTVALYSSGKIYDAVGGSVGNSGSGSGYNAFATAVVNWDHYPITSTACSAWSTSTVDYSGTCVDHVGLTVSYPTCVTGTIP